MPNPYIHIVPVLGPAQVDTPATGDVRLYADVTAGSAICAKLPDGTTTTIGGQPMPAMQQQTWFIDPTSGSNVNTGLTAATAIQTDAERRRRMGPRPDWSLAEYHLHYLSSLPAADPLILTGTLSNPNTNIYVHGSATPGQGQTGGTALAANTVVALAHATNTPMQVTANGLTTSWTTDALLNKRCRMTSGSNVGGVMWPMAEPGAAKLARMSEPAVVGAFTNPFTASLTSFTPGTNDTFIVETLTNLAQITIDLVASTTFNAASNAVCFDSVILNKLSVTSYGIGVNTWGCDWASSIINGFPRLVQCVGTRFRASAILAANVWQVFNCYNSDEAAGFCTFRAYGTGCVMSRHIVYQRQGLALSAPNIVNQASIAPIKISHIGIFNNTAGNAVEVAGFAKLDSTAEIWGICGAGGTPMALAVAGLVGYNAVPPGVASFFYVDCSAAPGAAWISYRQGLAWQTTAPAWDPATSAYTAYRNLTPALLQATIAGGGFNCQFNEPQSGARLASI